MIIRPGIVLSFLLLIHACEDNYEQGSFGHDIQLLSEHSGLVVLGSGESMIAVAEAYQGRVMTSSMEGMEGNSLGWFDREGVLDPGRLDAFSSIGGESRLWFGPEAGKFSLFFEPGVEQVSENVRHPGAISRGQYLLEERSDQSVSFKGRLSLVNYSGTPFDIEIERRISVFDRNEIQKQLDISLGKTTLCVGFEAHSTMTNKGDQDWSRETGLLSLWELGCFPPSATIVIPVKNDPDSAMIYFTPIDESRLRIKDGVLFYRCDADYLNKIGIPPEYATPVFGSWNAETGVLTVVKFSFAGDGSHDRDGSDAGAESISDHEALYVNSHWVYQEDPYGGDVINVFNDGEYNGGGPFGPFYELETSSAAHELKVGESLIHSHATFHFKGSREDLDQLAGRIFGAGLGAIEGALP